MLENEKERGKEIANLPPLEKNNLVARLMFGQHWQKAREALIMLMEAWGIAASSIPDTQGGDTYE